ncbi:MAG TPA: hypothetical protein VFT37_02110 [Telluria sp.]|nr:hypothetical protein [Telluria sp.]
MKSCYAFPILKRLQTWIVSLLLGMAAFSLPAFGQAGPPATYDAFSIDYFTGTKDGVSFSPEMLLLDSDSPLKMSFSLDGLQTIVSTDSPYPASQDRSVQIGISPTPGYRITKVLVTMGGAGQMNVPLVFTQPGYELITAGRVENTFSTYFSSTVDGAPVYEPEEFHLSNVNTSFGFDYWIGPVMYGQQLVISTGVDLALSGWPSYFRSMTDPLAPEQSLPSYGVLGVQTALIVYSEPIGAIPEPASWMMLALGLMVLRQAGRARRS